MANLTNVIPAPGEGGRDTTNPASVNVIPSPGEGPRALSGTVDPPIPPGPDPRPPALAQLTQFDWANQGPGVVSCIIDTPVFEVNHILNLKSDGPAEASAALDAGPVVVNTTAGNELILTVDLGQMDVTDLVSSVIGAGRPEVDGSPLAVLSNWRATGADEHPLVTTTNPTMFAIGLNIVMNATAGDFGAQDAINLQQTAQVIAVTGSDLELDMPSLTGLNLWELMVDVNFIT